MEDCFCVLPWKENKKTPQLSNKGNTNRKIFLMNDLPENHAAHTISQMGNLDCTVVCSIAAKGAAFASVSNEIFPDVQEKVSLPSVPLEIQ